MRVLEFETSWTVQTVEEILKYTLRVLALVQQLAAVIVPPNGRLVEVINFILTNEMEHYNTDGI